MPVLILFLIGTTAAIAGLAFLHQEIIRVETALITTEREINRRLANRIPRLQLDVDSGIYCVRPELQAPPKAITAG